MLGVNALLKSAHRLQGWVEQRFPNWAHRRHHHKWERKWADPEYNPFWKTDRPQKELVEATSSGWFAKNQRVIDVGCGNGEVSWWLAEQGYTVLGLDYSAAAIDNCRRRSAGTSNAPTFEVADFCSTSLRLEPAGSVIDRGCFHRIAENSRPIFALNIAAATVEGGHFVLLAGTFQHPQFLHYPYVRSERELREHVEEIFGRYFAIERAEPGVINAAEGEQAMPAVAFWMVRKPESPTRQG